MFAPRLVACMIVLSIAHGSGTGSRDIDVSECIDFKGLGQFTLRTFVWGSVSLATAFAGIFSASYYTPSLEKDIAANIHDVAYAFFFTDVLVCGCSLAKNYRVDVKFIKLTIGSFASILGNILFCAFYLSHKVILRTPPLAIQDGTKVIFGVSINMDEFPMVVFSHSAFTSPGIWIAALTTYVVLNFIVLGAILNSTIQWTSDPKAPYHHMAVVCFNDMTYSFLAWHESLHFTGYSTHPLIRQNVMWMQLLLILWVLPADSWCIVQGFLYRAKNKKPACQDVPGIVVA